MCYYKREKRERKQEIAECALITNIHSACCICESFFLDLIQGGIFECENENRERVCEMRRESVYLGCFCFVSLFFLQRQWNHLSQANRTNAKILILSGIKKVYLLLFLSLSLFNQNMLFSISFTIVFKWNEKEKMNVTHRAPHWLSSSRLFCTKWKSSLCYVYFIWWGGQK